MKIADPERDCYFACDQVPLRAKTRLPEAVFTGGEPFMIWGAIAGG